jgi:hypothetical protein
MRLFGEHSLHSFHRRFVALDANTGRMQVWWGGKSVMYISLVGRMPFHWQETTLFSPTCRQAVRNNWGITPGFHP